MKKSLFNTLGAIGIMSLIALNVYVVTSKETPAFLKWDVIEKILADGTNGSGSGINNSNHGGLYNYLGKGGDPKKCTLWAEYDASGNVVSTSSSEIEVTAGFTVRRVTGAEEYCPKKGNGCTVYSCRITDN